MGSRPETDSRRWEIIRRRQGKHEARERPTGRAGATQSLAGAHTSPFRPPRQKSLKVREPQCLSVVVTNVVDRKLRIRERKWWCASRATSYRDGPERRCSNFEDVGARAREISFWGGEHTQSFGTRNAASVASGSVAGEAAGGSETWAARGLGGPRGARSLAPRGLRFLSGHRRPRGTPPPGEASVTATAAGRLCGRQTKPPASHLKCETAG